MSNVQRPTIKNCWSYKYGYKYFLIAFELRVLFTFHNLRWHINKILWSRDFSHFCKCNCSRCLFAILFHSSVQPGLNFIEYFFHSLHYFFNYCSIRQLSEKKKRVVIIFDCVYGDREQSAFAVRCLLNILYIPNDGTTNRPVRCDYG